MKTVLNHIAAASFCLLFVLSGSALQAKDTGDVVTGSEAKESAATVEESEAYQLLEEVVGNYEALDNSAILPGYQVKVYNIDSELIYEGSVDFTDLCQDKEGRKILKKCDLLFKSGNVKYYMLK